MTREILTIGDPFLRRPVPPMTRAELARPATQALIDALVETMHAANGAGLAANQTGAAARICVIEVTGDNPRYPEKKPIPLTVLVNPEIEPLDDTRIETFEGCLSVPGLRGRVSRHARVRVRFWDRDGAEQVREVEGIRAVTYQHECDHLDGLLFVDRADPTTLTTWDNYHRFHAASVSL